MTMVLDDAALLEVTAGPDGLLTTDGEGRVLVDMSTVSPNASRTVADAAGRAGTGYLRAPVSGNPSVVEAGNLGIIVSGDEQVFRRTEELLHDIGPNVFYVGGSEEARVLKLALNRMIAGSAQLIAEALVLGEAHGLDRARMLEVIGASAAGSPFVKYKTAALVQDDYTATFTAYAMWKDLSLALAAAHEARAPLPVTATIQQLVEGCLGSGWAEVDLMASFRGFAGKPGSTPACRTSGPSRKRRRTRGGCRPGGRRRPRRRAPARRRGWSAGAGRWSRTRSNRPDRGRSGRSRP